MLKYFTSELPKKLMLLTLVILVLPIVSFSQTYVDCTTNTTYVGGQVYLDYNSNKLWENTAGTYTENGAPGVTVYAYDKDDLLLGSTTTDAAGGWAILVGNGTQVRVEYSLPEYFKAAPAGSASKSCVSFATAPACDLNFGVHDPLEHCESDPEIMTICNVKYFAPASEVQILSLDFSDGGNSAVLADYHDFDHPVMVGQGQTGNLWGLTFSQDKNMLYASTTYKKSTDVSPDGLGSIYYVDNSANTGVSGSVTTATLLTTLAAGSDPTAGNPGDADAGETYFDAAFDAPAKRGLGGIALNGKEDSLWTVNLFTRKLVGMKLDAAGTGIVGGFTEISMPSPASCNGDEIRPWALKWYRGKFYVGMVCSGEVTEDVNMLRAYVYTYTPGDASMSANPVIDFPLNYGRTETAWNVPAEWNPWKTVWNAANPIAASHFNPSNQGAYPSPILSDIEFDNGDMIIALLDRFNDQFQSDADPAGNINPGGTVAITSGGDLLKAGLNADGVSWTLESNCAVASASKGTYSSSATEAGAGPGGKEFYHDDRYSSHGENTLGGLANLPGRHEVVVGAFDPTVEYYEAGGSARWGSGGLVWHDNQDGTISKAWEGYYDNVVGDFGKGNGFGDIEAVCLTKPKLQIGNLVWSDENNNGVQDADEVGLAGVDISLYNAAGTLLATTTSDANGNYFFSEDGETGQTWITGGDEVEANTTYYVVFGSGQFSANKLTMTGDNYLLVPDNASSASVDPKMVDSDAAVGSGADPAFVMDMPFKMVLTGAAGENEQNVDVGFFAESNLPVELIEFTGREEDCKINLQWTVGAQDNFSHFEIEQGSSSRSLMTIAEQSPKAAQSTYTLKGIESWGAQNYFRLKMVDWDGSFHYSEMISLRSNCHENLILKLYPNPSEANVSVNAEIIAAAGAIQVTVIDALGRVVLQEQGHSDGNSFNLELPTNGLNAGTFTVLLMDEAGHQMTKRLVLTN